MTYTNSFNPPFEGYFKFNLKFLQYSNTLLLLDDIDLFTVTKAS